MKEGKDSFFHFCAEMAESDVGSFGSGFDSAESNSDPETDAGTSSEESDDENERVWTDANDEPDVPPFTGDSGVQVDVEQLGHSPLAYLKLFLSQASSTCW